MKNSFHASPKRPLHDLTYTVAIGLTIAALVCCGEPLRLALARHFSLFEVFVGLGFATYLWVFWSAAAAYALYDRIPAMQRYRIQHRPDGSVRTPNPKGIGHTVRLVLFNQFFGTLPVLVGVYYLMVWRGMSLDDPTPAPLTILLHLGLIILIEEVLFYAVHALMHTKPLMKRFHRIHHEYKEPLSITTHYVHPVEHLAGNLLPIFAGPLLLGSHMFVTLMWVVMAVVNALHTHSNYDFPWMSWSVDHDWHHYNVRGNYGVLGLLDRAFGTWTLPEAPPEETSSSRSG